MATTPLGKHGLSAQERRQRNRQEMREALIEVAREIMREQGAGALSLHELTRRVGISTPAFYTYFQSKMDLYDALFHMGIHLFHEAEQTLWQNTKPDWERIQAWFELRLRQAEEHPDLYHLIFDNAVPQFQPSPESMEGVWKLYDDALRAITEVYEAGVIQPGIPLDEALNLLLSMRRGIVAEHMGKGRRLDPPDRFSRIIPQILAILRVAWTPRAAGSAPGPQSD